MTDIVTQMPSNPETGTKLSPAEDFVTFKKLLQVYAGLITSGGTLALPVVIEATSARYYAAGATALVTAGFLWKVPPAIPKLCRLSSLKVLGVSAAATLAAAGIDYGIYQVAKPYDAPAATAHQRAQQASIARHLFKANKMPVFKKVSDTGATAGHLAQLPLSSSGNDLACLRPSGTHDELKTKDASFKTGNGMPACRPR